MQSQSDLIKRLSRAHRIIQARAVSEEEANRVESEVVLELLGPLESINELGVRTGGATGLRAFSATERVGKALNEVLTKLAGVVGVKAARAGTFDPLFASVKTFRDVWRLRQVIDQLAIPYEFYADAAAQYWTEGKRKRMPRISQLMTPEVIAYVIEKWVKSLPVEPSASTDELAASQS